MFDLKTQQICRRIYPLIERDSRRISYLDVGRRYGRISHLVKKERGKNIQIDCEEDISVMCE